MGTFAGYEEKEFEALANASFVLQSSAAGPSTPKLFSPGQVLERRLGFDFSVYLDPTSTTYKLLFGAYPGPVTTPGATRTPTPLPTPARYVNSFIQYKRPEYFKQNHRQNVWGEQSFLRFSVRSRYQLAGQSITDHTQLEALDDLASHHPSVKVRYACPSVWTRQDLYTQYSTKALISGCAFTDPRNLSHVVNSTHVGWHNYWTFSPLNPGIGRPNPSGPTRSAQTGEDFMQEVRSSLDSQSSHDFRDDIFDIQSGAKEMLKNVSFFRSQSGVRGRTKAEFVEQARRSTQADFLDSPRDENWLLQGLSLIHI